MRTHDRVAAAVSRVGWILVATVCVLAAAGCGALSQAYRGTLVRALRTRHPTEFALSDRSASYLRDERELLRFARSRRYFRLNDADLVSEARNFYYNRLGAYALALAALAACAAAARTRS